MAISIEQVLKIFYLSGAKYPDMEKVFGECEEYNRVLESLEKNDKVNLIREFCKLRNIALFKHNEIDHYVVSVDKTFEQQECLKDIDFKLLYDNGWNRRTNQSKVIFAEMNEEISRNIHSIKDIFPTWINFTYIRDLFVVKGLGKKDATKKLSPIYKNAYNFNHVRKMEVFLNIDGKIPKDTKYYFNDLLFFDTIYTLHNETFEHKIYVKKTNMFEKSKIETFLSGADLTNVYVDCENVGSDNVLSVIKSLTLGENKNKINKIFLVSDEQAASSWEYLTSFCRDRLNFDNIEFILVERTANQKSQVDFEIVTHIIEVFYRDNIKDFVIVSSDSDYKIIYDKMIKKDANMFFCIEKKSHKLSNDYLNELIENNTSFCSIDDFNKEVCLEFWKYVFAKSFQIYVGNLNEILQQNPSSAFIENFYNQFTYNDISSNIALKNYISKKLTSLKLEIVEKNIVIKE